MQTFTVALAFLFVVCVPVSGQTTDDEVSNLRELLNVPASTQIKLASNSTLPDTAAIKLFIATGLDIGVRNNYSRWIEEWNKKDGKKYGVVEIVSDISQADVILARYTVKERARTTTNTVVVPGTVYDPATNSTISRPVPRTYSYDRVPVFAYVINRKPDGLEILWRYADDSATYQETKNSGRVLWDDFKRMMKARAKNKRQ